MTETNEQAPTEATTPDYLTSPNAVFADEGVQWRYGKPPDYSKTRKVWEEGRKMNHAAGSLEQVVENLVKNWEVEASFKPRLQDWRTIDPANYAFAMSGGPPQTAEHMLKVGTYNAIIEPNEYYDPNYSDFASSHKTFKRMMPTFAWEVLEVYSGPPKVAFRWRHWGEMKNDYVGFNNKGEKVTAKAHGGPIEIFGTTVATVDDKVRLQSVDTYMDPLAMFRQIAPHGIVNMQPMDHRVDRATALDSEPELDNHGVKIAEAYNDVPPKETGRDQHAGEDVLTHISLTTDQPAAAAVTPQQAGGCPFVTQHGAMLGTTQPPHGHSEIGTSQDPVGGPCTTVQSGHKGNSSMSQSVDVAPQFGAESSHSAAINDDPASAESTQARPNIHEAVHTAQQPIEMAIDQSPSKRAAEDDIPRSIYSSAVSGDVEDVIKIARSADYVDESTATGTHDEVDRHLESSADVVHPHPKSMEQAVQPAAGEAVVVPVNSKETKQTVVEMSDIKPSETDLIMNRE